MNLSEAYIILGVSEDISDEDLKKKHKQLCFEFHPDKYKIDPNKLKHINEAFQLVTDARQHPEKYQTSSGFGNSPFINISDIFSSFMGGNQYSTPKQYSASPKVEISISFRESILGCQKQITYKRNGKCSSCEGKGIEFLGNGCKECNGFGKKITNSGNMHFQTQCGKCHGTNVKNKKCEVCKTKGCIEQDISTSITVPPGVPNDVTMELPHAGHFQGAGLFGEQYSSVHIHVRVEPIEGLELVGQDVVSKLTIPLIEALVGKKYFVTTIDGQKEITIEPLTKNAAEVKLVGLGVAGKGDQRVIVEVKYPDDVSKLIEVLKG